MDIDSEELEATIKAQVEEWSTNSNDCFTIELLRGDGAVTAQFQPEFTYPIFGEEEAIFGYQDLTLHLCFAAHNLKPHLKIGYSEKFKAMQEVKPTNIKDALKDFLPASAFADVPAESALADEAANEFVPPGKRLHKYKRNGSHFEVWCASLADRRAKQLLENMEVLVPMFIEGGTMLQIEQDWTTQRWKLFLLYQLHATESRANVSKYSLCGYGTSYRIFSFPDRQRPEQSELDNTAGESLESFLDRSNTTNSNEVQQADPSPLDLPSRERLSQFLILPPFQRGGHGQELYNTMYTTLSQSPNIREFTVEDPNEAFDELRDRCDLLNLRAHSADFRALRIQTDLPASALRPDAVIPTDLLVPASARTAIKRATKIDSRQLDRLIEMHTLSFIPALHRSRTRITRKEKSTGVWDRAYYLWRLYVKQRLYVFNRDQLIQVEGAERIEKLEAAVDSVVEGYVAILEKVEKREKEIGETGQEEDGEDEEEEEEEGVEASVPRSARKRKVIDEEDDEDGPGEVVGLTNGDAHKKVRAN